MNSKKVISAFLLVFVTVSVVFLIIQNTRDTGFSADKNGTGSNDSDKVTTQELRDTASTSAEIDSVYYFMTSQRCQSCMKIERYSQEAVVRNFAEDLKSGRIVWCMVAVDTPENNHFVKDYQLYTKSVVLVKNRNCRQERWKNLEEVWTLLGDKEEFISYVTDEVNSFMEKG